MKKLLTLLMLLMAIIGNTQSNCYWGGNPSGKRNLEGYFGASGGSMRNQFAFGMTAGVSVKRVTLAGTLQFNQYGTETTLGLGYIVQLTRTLTIMPKAGMMWGQVNGSKEYSPAYGPGTQDDYQYTAIGAMASWHINNGSIFFEAMGKSMAIGVRFMSFLNEKE